MLSTRIAFLLLSIILISSCSKEEQIILPENLRLGSQEELDIYREQLKSLDTFNGNIDLSKSFENLEGTPLSDISAFCNLKKINGDLLISDYTGSNLDDFSNLEVVSGAIYITSESLVNVIFPSLKEVNGLVISFSPSLEKVSFPSLGGAINTVDISNNRSLLQIDGFDSVENLNRLLIDNNQSLNFINAFANLKNVVNILSLECYEDVNLTQPSLNCLSSATDLQLTITREDGLRLDWLDLEYSESVLLRGLVELEDLCDLKPLAENYPSVILINHFDTGLFSYAGDLIEACK